MLAVISKMEEQLAALKTMVLASEKIEVPSTEGLPGSDYDLDAKRFTPDGRELLPDPPKVIYVDLPKESKVEAPDEDTVLGCQIITELPDFYTGKCSVLKIQKRYFDNSDKGFEHLWIDKYHVCITACDREMKVIGTHVTHWNNLAKFHAALLKKGINTHDKKTWMPKTLLFDLD